MTRYHPARSMLRRRALIAPFALLALSLPGCATVTGTIVGPVAYPISDINHTKGVPWWARIFTVPFGIIVGPAVGFGVGASADYGLVKYGAYGQVDRPPFGRVFDPLDTERDWDKVTPR